MATTGLFLSRMTENSLENTFEIVRSSIVAFASRVVRKERPQFPEIIGTGFLGKSQTRSKKGRYVTVFMTDYTSLASYGIASLFDDA